MRTLVKYLAVVLVFTAVMYADTEGFDNIASLPGWQMQNNSAPVGATGWFQGNDAIFTSFSGAPDSYIAANFLNAGFGGNIDNWLLAPVVTLRNGDMFSFYTMGAGTLDGGIADRLQVYLNTGGALGTGLALTINPQLDPLGYPDAWTQYVITVSGLAGPTPGRLEFNYNVTDTSVNGDYIGIDSYEYTPTPEPVTMTTVGLGLAAMAIRRKLRRN